jgi:hypothetical protein
MVHLADALANTELTESPTELVFTTPKMFEMFLKQKDFAAMAIRVAGRPVRVTVNIGEAFANQPQSGPMQTKSAARPPASSPGQSTGQSPGQRQATERAMAHPEVQRFKEIFPDSQVRTVRNLKDE